MNLSNYILHFAFSDIYLLQAKMIADNGDVYEFDIFSEDFVHVKMAWIFLGFVLFGSAIIFPIFKFSPPRYIII